jgi:pyruvate formate lyase activating enzyme
VTSGLIFDIKRFALHDGPGTRTTVFLKGCPLRCQWCHNPEGISPDPLLTYHSNRCMACLECINACPEAVLEFKDHRIIRHTGCTLCAVCVDICPTGAWEISGKKVEALEIIQKVEKDFLFFDQSEGGITFSGGEPLYQIDFLLNLLQLARLKGFHTAVDTSGIAPLRHYQQISSLVDLFLFDIKCLDEQKHRYFTAVSNQLILSNFKILANTGKDIFVRIPVIPGFNDNPEEILRISNFVKENSSVRRIDLLPYHAMAKEKYRRLDLKYPLEEKNEIDPGFIESMKIELEQEGFICMIGG